MFVSLVFKKSSFISLYFWCSEVLYILYSVITYSLLSTQELHSFCNISHESHFNLYIKKSSLLLCFFFWFFVLFDCFGNRIFDESQDMASKHHFFRKNIWSNDVLYIWYRVHSFSYTDKHPILCLYVDWRLDSYMSYPTIVNWISYNRYVSQLIHFFVNSLLIERHNKS